MSKIVHNKEVGTCSGYGLAIVVGSERGVA